MAELFAGKEWQTFLQILPTIPFETWETVWSTVVATRLALVIGLPLGVCLVTGEQGGVRPVLIVQNDTGNRYSPTVIAAAITSQTNKAKLPTHIALSAPDYGLPRDSVVLLEQIRTLDKRRLRERMGRVDGELMERIDAAIAVSFGLQNTQLV